MITREFCLETPAGETEDLNIVFLNARENDAGLWSIDCSIKSTSWKKSFTFNGVDGLQALLIGLKTLPAFFAEIERKEGFRIWFLEEGDCALDDSLLHP